MMFLKIINNIGGAHSMGLGVENSTACTFFPREFSQDSKGKLFIHGLESALDHFAKKAHAAQVELMSSKETFLSTAKELRKAEAQLNFHKKQMHKKHKSHKKMHHAPKPIDEYCYAGGTKRYDSLGNLIKKDRHDHCRHN